MASLEILYQQEEQLNACVCDILCEAQYGLAAYWSHDTREKPADHVDVKAELGEANGHRATNGEWDSFAFSLVIRIVSERSVDEPTPERHALMKSKCRAAMSVLRAEFSAGNLPYLQINELIPAGTSVEFDNSQERARDITTLTYRGTVGIQPSAWTA